jgi:hypothetical protein
MLPLLLACSVLRPTPTVSLGVTPAAASHAQSIALSLVLWVADLPTGRDDRLDLWAKGDPQFNEGLVRDGWLEPAVLEISQDSVVLSGAPVMTLTGGVPDPADVRVLLLHPLFDAVQASVDRNHALDGMVGADRELNVLVVIDGGVPWSTVQAALYTTSQAEIDTFWFEVVDPGAPAWTEPTFSADSRDVQLLVGSDGLVQRQPRYPEPPDSTRGTVSQVLAAGFEDPGAVDCAALMPEPASSWADVLAPLDALNAAGVHQVLLASDGVVGTPSPATTSTSGAPRTLTLDARVSVFRMDRPTIGPPGSSTEPEKGECHLELEAAVYQLGTFEDQLGVFEGLDGLGGDLDEALRGIGSGIGVPAAE